MEQILIDNGFEHIRTIGNKKEYERTLGDHKMRVRPSAKSIYIEYEMLIGLKHDIKAIRVDEDVAIEIVKAFVMLHELLC